MKYPKSFLDHMPLEIKNEIIHKMIQMWFNDDIHVVMEDTEEFKKGQFLYNKTGLNKMKDVFLQVLSEANSAAIEGEKDLNNIMSAASAELSKELTPEERLKKAGLHSVKLKTKQPKKLITGV